jgi:hypothetical protein
MVIFSLLAGSKNASAQVLDFDSKAIEQDFVYNLGLYAENYIGSELDAYSLNKIGLWQTSGNTLQPFAFRFSLQNSVTLLKSSDVKFNFNEAGFSQNMQLENPSDSELPTVLGGPTDKNIVYTVRETRTGITHKQAFPALSGIKTPFNSIPGSAIILSVGLPANLEVGIRFFPKITAYNVDHFEIGGALKHQLSQYFWKEDFPLNLGISVQYNYSKYLYSPEDLLDGKDQQIILKDHIVNAELAASYDKKWFTVFLLAGAYSSTTQFNINGTYSFEVEQKDPILGLPIVSEAFSTVHPVSLEAKSISPRVSLGASVKIVHLAELAFAYSIAEYNTLSVNISFNINNKPK